MDIVIVCIAVFGWFCMMPNLFGEGYMRKIPRPPEHLRPKKNGSVPRMRNPPAPPKKWVRPLPTMKNPLPPPLKKGNCYLDCGNTKPFPCGNGSICLNCGSSILKDEELEFLRSEFPKDRIE